MGFGFGVCRGAAYGCGREEDDAGGVWGCTPCVSAAKQDLLPHEGSAAAAMDNVSSSDRVIQTRIHSCYTHTWSTTRTFHEEEAHHHLDELLYLLWRELVRLF